MASPPPLESAGLKGLTVASFESRMAKEMWDLIERHGGTPRVAPSMREIPLSDNQEAFDFFERLKQSPLDFIVFMTGIGTRILFQALLAKYPKHLVEQAFKRVTLAARGAKAVKSLNEFGFRAYRVAEEPNTWREMLAALGEVKGKKIAVQEYGTPNQEFYKALRREGALEIIPVPVYRWALPEDTGPLKDLITDITEGQVQVALFTSATQIYNTLAVAREMGLEKKLKTAFTMMAVGSVGSVTTMALRGEGIVVDFEPDHPKMGFLVKEAAEKALALIPGKLNQAPTLSSTHADSLQDSLFLKACRKQATPRPPSGSCAKPGVTCPSTRKSARKSRSLSFARPPNWPARRRFRPRKPLGWTRPFFLRTYFSSPNPWAFSLNSATRAVQKSSIPSGRRRISSE